MQEALTRGTQKKNGTRVEQRDKGPRAMVTTMIMIIIIIIMVLVTILLGSNEEESDEVVLVMFPLNPRVVQYSQSIEIC